MAPLHSPLQPAALRGLENLAETVSRIVDRYLPPRRSAKEPIRKSA